MRGDVKPEAILLGDQRDSVTGGGSAGELVARYEVNDSMSVYPPFGRSVTVPKKSKSIGFYDLVAPVFLDGE